MIPPVMPTYRPFDLAIARGEGVYVWDEADRRYLDFNAGIATLALGHAHPALIAALTAQAHKVWHTSNVFRIPGQIRLAERLVAASFADTVFFTNSGAEAVECAIKTARRHFSAAGAPHRQRIITFSGAFHGRTIAALAAGGNPAHLEGFGDPAPGFDQVPFGDHDALHAAVGPETAAVLVEPVQGEGGVRLVPDQCLQGLRAFCDEHGLLLMFDEVQCGMGRTGKLFAHEWAGVRPDIVATAKGLGSGFPLGACLATERAAAGMTLGAHGSTLGGNPLAMAVGNAVLDHLLADGFLAHVREMGALLETGLAAVVEANPSVLEEVRGRGLLRAVRCRGDNREVLEACLANGLLAAAGADQVLRLLPPLIVEPGHIEEACARLGRACQDVAAQRGGAS